MARPAGPVWRQRVAPQRGLGQECEQDTGLASLKEDVTARLLADDRQAQDRPVEAFRRPEVIDVNSGFDNGLDVYAHLQSGRSFRRLQPGPGLGQLLLQAALDGEDPLGDLEPAGVQLPAKVAG